ncbi:DUF2071 domain-containing protein [Flavobacterium sp. F372]|uniref:DUF2071 domain-containing protein n=1 Tax=Flavobacterium bernardetii TaxID=2813823 RepID=A0ABR7J1N9_9FLAO|nr:DUF2071 domain-containing protein [Flavobacterium bernardetii]MBC5835950.1 DUF2071 domain-containing protein [Flavobacterium bernardetii]NHF71104.1 DUF2071 domain-containing protein [Flavobacterium bernardetii]
MSFLTAKWTNLALINYKIDAKILEKYVPNGTELDFWDNKCYISLVGFMFEDVKLLGLKIPLHTNFEEVNLRFYVKRFEEGKWKRGVVFIKEIVPKLALKIVANTVFKENYETLPMKHKMIENENTFNFTYEWKKEQKWHSIALETEKKLIKIEENSEAQFITEHYFGYTKVNHTKTFEYEVKHPIWKQYNVLNSKIDVDFKATYGDEFAFMKDLIPTSIILAKGSKVSVENKIKIK